MASNVAVVGKAIAGEAIDPRVTRIAVEGLIDHPRRENIGPLVTLFGRTAAEDESLRHTLRLALRSHLRLDGGFAELNPHRPSATVLDELAFHVAPGIQSPEAAAFLIEFLENRTLPPEHLATVVRHVSRNSSGGSGSINDPGDGMFGRLIRVLRGRNPDNVQAQGESLGWVIEGLAEGGKSPSAPVLAWAQENAEKLLATIDAGAAPAWEESPNPGLPPSKSPWVKQKRRTADGREVSVISSLEIGGESPESRTGILRSRPFAAPSKLVFWMCGHRGAPDRPPHEKNHVRLADAAGGGEIIRAYPPRNDVCQKFEWDLAAHAGKSVRLEIVDGDTGGAFAWLGVTGFDPPVARVEAFKPRDSTRSRLQSLAALLKHSAPLRPARAAGRLFAAATRSATVARHSTAARGDRGPDP